MDVEPKHTSTDVRSVDAAARADRRRSSVGSNAKMSRLSTISQVQGMDENLDRHRLLADVKSFAVYYDRFFRTEEQTLPSVKMVLDFDVIFVEPDKASANRMIRDTNHYLQSDALNLNASGALPMKGMGAADVNETRKRPLVIAAVDCRRLKR